MADKKKKTKLQTADEAIEISRKLHAEIGAETGEPRPIAEGVPESVIQTEGKAHNADVEKADKRGGPRGPREPKPVDFPVEGKINKYGFLRFSNDVLRALGLPLDEDIKVKIVKTAKGVVQIVVD